MARHLLIGNGGVASLVNAASETDTAINVQKLSADGPVNMLPGDTVADSDSFRIVQGTAGNNIVSPWIKGRNVVNWSGVSGTAALPATATNTIAGEAAAAGEVVLKFVRTDGPAPEFFSFATAIAAGVAHTAADNLVQTAYAAATKPDWLATTCTAAGNSNVFTGAVRGDVAQSGNVWEYGPVNFELIVESYDGGTQTHTASKTQAPDPGIGDGNLVRDMEGNLQGISHGYYNRVQLPNAPGLTGVAATSYDMYSIVATKDGSTSSSINGVDNLIEINIASTADDAANALLEAKLNSYMASVNFPPVIL